MRSDKIKKQLEIEANSDLLILNLSRLSSCETLFYSDASLANSTDLKTQGGYFKTLNSSQNRKVLLTWHSKQIRSLLHSSLGAELLAFVDALDCAVSLRYKIYDVLGLSLKLRGITDNK